MQKAAGAAMWVILAPGLRGRVHVLDTSESLAGLARLEGAYPEGARVRCCVVTVRPKV